MKYDISNKNKQQIREIKEKFFHKVYIELQNNLEIDTYHLGGTLLLFSETRNYVHNQNMWEFSVKHMMLQVKKAIEKDVFTHNLGLFNGLAEIDLGVNTIYENTGMYKNFSEQIHIFFLDQAEKYIAYCISMLENLTVFHYDLVSGLAGIGNAILIKKNKNSRDIIILKQILYYLTILSWKITLENGESHPRFFIKSKNQFREDEKISFPNGNINFGLAHGMMGPLLLLSKTKYLNIEVSFQDEAIERLIDLYNNFSYKDSDGVLTWPTQLKMEDYNTPFKKDLYRQKRASWCYGTAGLSRGLYLVGKFNKNVPLKNIALESITALSNLEFEKYALSSPIVCHGYAGLLAILYSTILDERVSGINTQSLDLLIHKLMEEFNPESKFGFIGKDEAILPDKSKKIIIQDNLDTLEGATGIISVLSAIADKQDTKLFKQLFIE